jgi:hypothetical protein
LNLQLDEWKSRKSTGKENFRVPSIPPVPNRLSGKHHCRSPKMIDPMFAAHATQMRAHMHRNRRTAPPGLSRRRFTAMFAGAAAFVVAGISIYRLAKGKPVHNQQPSPFH